MRINPLDNQSPGDIADELAQAVRDNLIPGLECIACALAEPSLRARMWADHAAGVDDVVVALHAARLELEGMVICRRERAMVRRMIEEVRAITHPNETPYARPNGMAVGNSVPDTTKGSAT